MVIWDIEEALDDYFAALRAEAIALAADQKRHPDRGSEGCEELINATNDYRKQKRERFATLARMRREAALKTVSGLLKSWSKAPAPLSDGTVDSRPK